MGNLGWGFYFLVMVVSLTWVLVHDNMSTHNFSILSSKISFFSYGLIKAFLCSFHRIIIIFRHHEHIQHSFVNIQHLVLNVVPLREEHHFKDTIQLWTISASLTIGIMTLYWPTYFLSCHYFKISYFISS